MDNKEEEKKRETVTMQAQELEATFSSKKELYNFLVYEMGLLLPKVDSTNAHFYKQIISGRKKVRSAIHPACSHTVGYQEE